MRGRRPVPSRIKALTGNPGKRPLNQHEPRPEPQIPDCPPQLGPIAREEWDRLTTELASLRIVTALDRSALAAYCNAYGLWAEATEAIQKFGTMVKSPSGYPVGITTARFWVRKPMSWAETVTISRVLRYSNVVGR